MKVEPYKPVFSSAWPSPDTWERNRTRIERLYLDENRTLAEVMSIMKRDHHLKATVKMYKRRLKVWSIDSKNLKRDEVKQIACAVLKRNTIGKSSQIRKKGRDVNVQDALRYVQKREFSSLEEFVRAASPASSSAEIECFTPILLAGSVPRDEKSIRERPCLTTFPPSLFQPDAFQVPQRLFFHAQSYHQALFDAKSLSNCEKGWLQSQRSQHRCCGSHDDNFLDYYNISESLMSRNEYVRGRQLLSRACRMVERQLQNADPDLIRAMTAVHMRAMRGTQIQLWEVVLRHFYRVAIELLGRSHPLTQFAGILLNLDSSTSRDLLKALLKGTIEKLEESIGKWHRTVISARSQLLMNSDDAVDEQNYRDVLWRCELTQGRGNVIWLQMMYNLAWKLCRQGRNEEAETVVQDLFAADISNASSYSLRSLVVLSSIRYQQGDVLAAAEITQSCLETCVQLWGWNDPYTVYQVIRLADFGTALGRVEQAAELESRLHQILGPTEIQELLEP